MLYLQLKCIVLLCEGYLTTWVRAETACALIKKHKGNEDVDIKDCIEAAKSSAHVEQCERYLTHECGVCYGEFAMNKVILK